MTTSILEVVDLYKYYPNVQAVNGVSFSVNTGTCFSLLGPNGAGKTTTIEMMEGIIPPSQGQVYYYGEPLDARFRREAGIMFQATALQDHQTVAEALHLFSQFYPAHLSLAELSERCALSEFLQRDVRKLSGGQRQRLLLAIALVNDPKVIFLDEPTTGLDPQARRNFWQLVQTIKAQGKTIVLTTHYMDEAYELSDEIAIMDHGKIIAQGEPQELLAHHYEDVILQLPRVDYQAAHTTLELPVIENHDRVEIFTDQVDHTLQQLLAAGVPLARLRIRARTLEDLFLELTGQALRS